MANDDRWRNEQERDRYRDQDYGRMQGGRDQGSGRGSDYQGDGTIAQRGFGNERSGYNRDRGYVDEHRGGYGGGMPGQRMGRERGGYGGQREDRSYRDQGRSGAYEGSHYEDYETPGYGNWGMPVRRQHIEERGSGRGSGDERGLLGRAGDAISSWFSDEDDRHRQTQGGGEWRGQSHRGRGPKGYTRSDDRILEDLCERLTHDHYVDASEIEISVKNREVTLSGTVDSREARRRAEDIAESISGVTHVQNNLRVQQSGMSSGLGSNAGVTSGGGLTGSAMAGGAGMTTGMTEQTNTGVEVSRTEGTTSRRKTGKTA